MDPELVKELDAIEEALDRRNAKLKRRTKQLIVARHVLRTANVAMIGGLLYIGTKRLF